MRTTTIGSYPKPWYVPVPDWFTSSDDSFIDRFDEARDNRSEQDEALIARGAREIIRTHQEAGLHTFTDGEVGRDDYIFCFLRALAGVSFKREEKLMRAGTWKAKVPVVVEKPSHKPQAGIITDFLRARPFAGDALKVTLPGPLTLCDTVKNKTSLTEPELAAAFVEALAEAVTELHHHGCTRIQIDEPVLLRRVDDARSFALDQISKLFSLCPDTLETTLHICCGYPDTLDNPEFSHSDHHWYATLAPEFDALGASILSLEHARCGGSLEYLSTYTRSQIALGVVSIAYTRIEAAEEIDEVVKEALRYVPAERLLLAPDCGMGMLPAGIARQKLVVLGQAGARY